VLHISTIHRSSSSETQLFQTKFFNWVTWIWIHILQFFFVFDSEYTFLKYKKCKQMKPDCKIWVYIQVTQFKNLVWHSCDSPDDDLGKVRTCNMTPVHNKQILMPYYLFLPSFNRYCCVDSTIYAVVHTQQDAYRKDLFYVLMCTRCRYWMRIACSSCNRILKIELLHFDITFWIMNLLHLSCIDITVHVCELCFHVLL
jgi:hypothetical protein